ncbi:hypothetical protein [Actinoplanes sp. CA-252034]|uniref:hypothetical protein n=1 Tax=Actinoplanes sp. CA-252034 TaxID=3239906 RepID=UPI003D96D169
MKRRLVLTTDASAGSRFPAEDIDAARTQYRSMIDSGLTPLVTGETTWTRDDFGQGRLCVFAPPIGPAINERGIVERKPCPGCRTMYYRLVPAALIDVTIPSGLPDIFTTESGLLTFARTTATATLTAQALMTGAVTIPTRDDRYVLLTSHVDLGLPAGPQYRRRCPECDAPLQGPTYFPMYRRPGTAADVCHTRELGPTGLVVSERFARAAGRLVGDPPDAPLGFLGWYPDDLPLAVVPDLDTEEAGDGE